MDAFSQYHPAVNFVFFVGAIGCGVVFQHPAYLLVGVLAAEGYDLLLQGKRAVKHMMLLLPLVLLAAAVNPLLNTRGDHVLFYLFSRPYTLEALLYGVAMAGILLVMLLWFGCYNVVMTGDKFTSLFGNLIPAVSLLLVMVLRMVPNLARQTRQILGARKSVGKGGGEGADIREKLDVGMTALSAMTSWALEGSIVTADSMRARGYGCARRRSFMVYRMSGRDWAMLAVMGALLTLVVLSAVTGQTRAEYLPQLFIAPPAWGVWAYGAYLLLPTALHVKEDILWHISRSKI